MINRFFDHFANTINRPKDENRSNTEEHGLSDFLSASQRAELMVLISTTMEHMREKIKTSFEALPIAQNQHSVSESREEHAPHETQPDEVKDSDILEAVGLDAESRAAAIAHFDDWQSSVLLRVGQIVNTQDDSENNKVPVTDMKQDPTEEKTPNYLQQVYPPLDTPLRDGPKAQRLLILRSLLLLLLGLEHYNAYSRVLLLYITSSLNLQLSDINENENKIARGLLDAAVTMTADEEAKKKAAENQNLRQWKVGLATVAGAALIGITGGLAAPLVAAGLGTVMGGLGLGGTIAASYLGALASSGVVVGSLFGAYGGKMTGKMMDNYAREVEDFAFIPIRGNLERNLKDEKQAAKEDHRLRVTIGITGWATNEENLTMPWRVIGPESEVFALRWEFEALLNLGNAMRILVTTAAWKVASHQVLIRTVFAGLMSAVFLPMGLLRLAKIAANPFSVAMARADKAGEVLADALINGAQGKRPVTLIGYSLGSRVIYSCLQSLARRRAYGFIESAIFMGAPVPAHPSEWHPMRAVVAGRLVNVWSENDSVLALLYRATHLEVDISGLQPVKGVPNLENVDASATVSGHLRYQYLIGQVLADIGFEEIDQHELEQEKAALSAQDAQIEREQEQNERRKPTHPAAAAQAQGKPVVTSLSKASEKKIAEQRSESDASPFGTPRNRQGVLPQLADQPSLSSEHQYRHPLSTDHDSDEAEKDSDIEDGDDQLNFISMIDEEDEARAHQEIEQRTQEQLVNWRTRQMRLNEGHD